MLEVFHDSNDFFTLKVSFALYFSLLSLSRFSLSLSLSPYNQIIRPSQTHTYTIKDIEKLGTKKGIVSQSIKEILDSLVSDSLVQCEKIGTGNYYWSFTGASLAVKKKMVTSLEADIVKSKVRCPRVFCYYTLL
jgi:hypothetical protein